MSATKRLATTRTTLSLYYCLEKRQQQASCILCIHLAHNILLSSVTAGTDCNRHCSHFWSSFFSASPSPCGFSPCGCSPCAAVFWPVDMCSPIFMTACCRPCTCACQVMFIQQSLAGSMSQNHRQTERQMENSQKLSNTQTTV